MARASKEIIQKIIGRLQEKRILEQLLKSNKAEFVALFGRRRIGKTFLVRNFFAQTPCAFFHATGIQGGKVAKQLAQFSNQIGITFYGGAALAHRQNWFDVFEDLHKAIQQVTSSQPIVLFLDEFPWMATKRSGLLQVVDYYWNRFWSHDPRIKLIICGSSASWVIEKIINNKGGLHNRVTHTMRLSPFTLDETKTFLAARDVKLNQRQILDLYMTLGGVPHYLALVTGGLSANQCIEALCFQKDGALVDEFSRLFSSLFKEPETYINLIRKIAKYREGIGQTKIIQKRGNIKGGRNSQRLRELEEAGFILSFLPLRHREKGKYYKIADEFILFYLHWIEPHLSSIRKQDESEGYWMSKAQSPSWKSWAGYAFEAVCHKHIPQIRKALRIDPGADIGSWRYVPRTGNDVRGAQIDLLFDRSDDAVTVCEIKHSKSPFTITKEYAHILAKKIEVYKQQTRTKKQIFFAMITSGGLKQTKYSKEIGSQHVDLEDLFR